MSHSPVFALDNLRCMLRIDGLRREWGWDPVRQPSVRPGTDWGTQSVSWAIIFIIWPFSTVWKSKPPSVMRMLCCTWLLPRGGISWCWTRAQCSWGEMEGEGGEGGGRGRKRGSQALRLRWALFTAIRDKCDSSLTEWISVVIRLTIIAIHDLFISNHWPSSVLSATRGAFDSLPGYRCRIRSVSLLFSS